MPEVLDTLSVLSCHQVYIKCIPHNFAKYCRYFTKLKLDALAWIPLKNALQTQHLQKGYGSQTNSLGRIRKVEETSETRPQIGDSSSGKQHISHKCAQLSYPNPWWEIMVTISKYMWNLSESSAPSRAIGQTTNSFLLTECMPFCSLFVAILARHLLMVFFFIWSKKSNHLISLMKIQALGDTLPASPCGARSSFVQDLAPGHTACFWCFKCKVPAVSKNRFCRALFRVNGETCEQCTVILQFSLAAATKSAW